jgi:ribonuclease P protein component
MFAVLRRRGRRASSGPLALRWVPLPGGDPPRVAYAVGKAVGSAVVRNKLRRRLRWSLESVEGGLPPGAYLIRVSPSAVTMSAQELRTHVAALVATVIGLGDTPTATSPPAGGAV